MTVGKELEMRNGDVVDADAGAECECGSDETCEDCLEEDDG